MSRKTEQRLHLRARIREIRKEKKITQEEMALRMGISTAWYSRMERGLTTIDIDRHFFAILAALEVSLAEFTVSR